MHPICILLFDGLGDRAYPELGGRTSNEFATTPNLDSLVSQGSCGLLWPLGPGRAPSSEHAHWRMLGYLPEEFPGRAVLEALGFGLELNPRSAYAFAALRAVERRDGALWLTGRPAPDDEQDARTLLSAVSLLEIDDGGPRLSLSPLERGEGILAIDGGDHRVTDTESFFRDRQPVLRPRPLTAEAEATATLLESWSRAACDLLEAHPVNEARRVRGADSLNAVTLKWLGRPTQVPSFVERHGLTGAVIAESHFLKGLAQLLGLRFIGCEETDGASLDLARRLDLAIAEIQSGADFVLVHQKAVDEAGHTKKPQERVRVLEALDGPLARLPRSRVLAAAVVAVTGDHATPASPEVIHSGDPVPFVLVGPSVQADPVGRFGEAECAGGILGHLRGEDVMPVLLNAADRPLFLGSRPTTVPGAMGFPADVVPLDF